MRLLALVFIASGCLATAPVAPYVDPDEKPREQALAPIRIPIEQTRPDSVAAAMREMTTAGFDVVLRDENAGVLKAERLATDPMATAEMESIRSRNWAKLNREQRALLAEKNPDGASRLAFGATVTRRFAIALVLGDDVATVTPLVTVCLQYVDHARCGTPRDGFVEEEIQIVRGVVASILSNRKPESREHISDL